MLLFSLSMVVHAHVVPISFRPLRHKFFLRFLVFLLATLKKTERSLGTRYILADKLPNNAGFSSYTLFGEES